MKKLLFTLFLSLSTFSAISSQSIMERYARFLTDPNGYVAYKLQSNINIDGILDEADWQNAAPTAPFVDISGEGFPVPRFKTTSKMLWDDNYLYIGAVLEEPNVWADITKHDAIVYNNPDFEVFIDPDGDGQNYFEIEANAIGTIFDLFLQKPYRAFNRAFVTFSWDCPGMKLATHVDGTINDSRDTDKGWSIEIAIPRNAIAAEFDNYLKAGKYLRVGFSRVEWQVETDAQGKSSRKKNSSGGYLPEDNWTWGPTGMIAMHMPERWGYVYLSDKSVGSGTEEFSYPAERSLEKFLWAMFYEQNENKKKNGNYIYELKQFKLTSTDKSVLPIGSIIMVEATSNKFEITILKADGSTVRIDENGFLSRRNRK